MLVVADLLFQQGLLFLACVLYAAVEGLRLSKNGVGGGEGRGGVITCRKAENHGIYSVFCTAPLVLRVGFHGCLSVECGRLPGVLRVIFSLEVILAPLGFFFSKNGRGACEY